MPIPITNWFCPECRRDLASCEVKAGKHVECKTKAEWRQTAICTVAECSVVENDRGFPDPR